MKLEEFVRELVELYSRIHDLDSLASLLLESMAVTVKVREDEEIPRGVIELLPGIVLIIDKWGTGEVLARIRVVSYSEEDLNRAVEMCGEYWGKDPAPHLCALLRLIREKDNLIKRLEEVEEDVKKKNVRLKAAIEELKQIVGIITFAGNVFKK